MHTQTQTKQVRTSSTQRINISPEVKCIIEATPPKLQTIEQKMQYAFGAGRLRLIDELNPQLSTLRLLSTCLMYMVNDCGESKVRQKTLTFHELFYLGSACEAILGNLEKVITR